MAVCHLIGGELTNALAQSTLQVTKPPFTGHLSVSVLFLFLEGLCMGNPELAAPGPKKSTETSWGAALLQMELIIASYLRGNHLSNSTCIRHAFFKSGE